jgi:hypothetical protein
MKEEKIVTAIVAGFGVAGIIAVETLAIMKGIDGTALSISVGAISAILSLLIRNLIK